MSNYFINFPSVKYGKHTAKDITRKAKVIEKLKSNPYSFLPYTIEEGLSPEDVAHYYYDDVSLSWLVLLANNIVDWQSEWPLTEQRLNQYIEDKYVYECAVCTINRVDVDFIDPIFNNVAEIMVAIALNVGTDGIAVLDPTDDSYDSRYVTIKDDLLANANYGLQLDTDSEDSYQVQAFNYLKANLPDRIAEEIVRIPPKDELKQAFDVVSWTQSKDPSITRNIVEYRNENNEGEFEEVAISRLTYQALETVEGWRDIRIYDWEFEQNENKRQIKLVNEAFVEQVKTDLARVINE